MPVLMITSVDTIYQVSSEDTVPVNQPGAPRVEAQFNGFTQMHLQSPGNKIANSDIALHSFKQQQHYLNDAAQAVVSTFNPAKTDDLRFRATVKLKAVMGQMEPFDIDSESSGFAYSLSLALTWGFHKKLLPLKPDQYIFATGSVPVDGYIKPIGHLTKKIEYACSYVEQEVEQENDINEFYIFIPKGNLNELQNKHTLTDRVNSLGGQIIAAEHLYEALSKLTEDDFDGGIFAGNQNQFAGISSITYSNRHLFMGRDHILNTLYQDTLSALSQTAIHNVTGISGSGKSSAVVAGLIPRLIKPQLFTAQDTPTFNDNWKIITPYQFNSIDELLKELLGSLSDSKKTIEEWLSKKQLPDEILKGIKEYQKQHQHNNDGRYTLWVIDQYESIFTHPGITPKEAQNFFSLLALLKKNLSVHIITILRIEYIGSLGNHPSVDTQLPRHIPAKEISNIVSLQLQYHRLQTESVNKGEAGEHHNESLETRIQNDAVGKPLTSVSYLLQKMHQAMIDEDPSSSLLCHRHYEQAGMIDGVIIQQAELAINEVFDSQPLTYTEAEKIHAINAFFDAFIHMDTEGIITTKALANSDIKHYPDEVFLLINAFMAQGLIIDCGKNQTPKIKFAHDTLIDLNADTKWPRLQQWLDEHRSYLLWRNDVDHLFQHWKIQNESPEYHLKDKKILRSYQSFSKNNTIYNSEHRRFLAESISSKTKNLLSVGAISIIVIAAALGTIWNQYFRIKTEHYAFIGDHYGVPFGVHSLTNKQVEKRQFHYQLDFKAGKLISAARYNSFKRLKNDISRNNTALWKYTYTENGNLHTALSFSQNGRPVSTATYEFTQKKNKANITFKTRGSSTQLGNIIYQSTTFESYSKKKTEITQHRLEFNQQGLVIKRLFYNNHNQPAKDSSGAYGLKYEYDKNGLIRRLEYIGSDGSAISIGNTYARIYQRDNNGKIISKSWVDKNGEPALNASGFSQVTTNYDQHGNLTERQLYRSPYNPTTNKRGFSIAKAEYDEFGNQIKQQFFNQDGKPTKHQWGFAKVDITYDDYGNEIEWAYYDANNKPALRNNQFAKIQFEYDQWGNKSEERYYGINGLPTLHKYGFFRYTSKHDSSGNRLEENYFDINNKATSHKNGYATLRMKYDSNNNQIQRSYFDINNKPTLNQYGYARYDAIFDRRNNRTEVTFFGTDGKPTINKYGFSKIKMMFDARGNRTEISYYDKENKPVIQKQGIAKSTFTYDDAGNITEIRYYNKDSELTLFNGEIAIARLDYDNRGNTIHESYFGINNQPVLIKGRYHSKKTSYDEKDNPIESLYYDTQNNLVPID